MKIPKLTIGLYLLASAAAHTLAVYDASTFGLIYGLIFGGVCIALWVALAFLLRVQENARKDADARTESAIAAAWRGYNEWFAFHVGEADRLMAELRATIEPLPPFEPMKFGDALKNNWLGVVMDEEQNQQLKASPFSATPPAEATTTCASATWTA